MAKTKRTLKPKKRKAAVPIERRIVSSLRKCWYYSKLRRDAVLAAKDLGSGLYRCASCDLLHEKIEIDHIEPIGSTKDNDGNFQWTQYINRMLFCNLSNLQALCHDCHLLKNQLDREYNKSLQNKA